MRKLYSLVLIAAGLLIGTNTWAAYVAQIGTESYTTLKDAFDAVLPGETKTITMLDNAAVPSTIVINNVGVGKNITLDFNGKTVSGTGGNYVIQLYKGKLTLKNSDPNVGGLTHNRTYGIGVYGTYQEGINSRTAAEADLYTHLVIEEGVDIYVTKTTGLGVMVCAFGKAADAAEGKGTYIYKNTLKANGSDDSDPRGVANGVRVDIKGNIHGQKYAVQTNGQLACPLPQYETYFNDHKEDFYGAGTSVTMDIADTAYAPFIHIYPQAKMTAADAAGSAAVYSSGYARWLIEGECKGASGVYMKSGNITLDGATVTSNYNGEAVTQTGATKGVENSGGNAVVVESNGHYAGNCVLDIEEGTTITTDATKGTALLEVIANGDDSKVEEITISGGTFSGDNAIAITDETASADKVTVYGGSLNGSVAVGDEKTEEAIAAIFADGVYPTVDPTTGAVTINPGYSVKLNAYGYATFSATKAVKLPAGLEAYKATSMGTEYLDMTSLATAGQTIPAETGVFFSGEANTKVTLSISEESAVSVGDNLWKPAADWTDGVAQENAYVLSGNALYLYTKTAAIPSNKAYLQLPASGSAPARISLRFNQTEQTTAVENVAPEADKAVKFVGEDGKLYIRRGEAVYTVQGQLVK